MAWELSSTSGGKHIAGITRLSSFSVEVIG
jgi:hypothetical protein